MHFKRLINLPFKNILKILSIVTDLQLSQSEQKLLSEFNVNDCGRIIKSFTNNNTINVSTKEKFMDL